MSSRNGCVMTGRSSRTKGARGQTEFKAMLLDRDWLCDQITAGIAACDLIATDTGGKSYSVEIKNCASIIPAHKRQAMEQAKARRLPWLLANKLPGTSSWLVQRQDGPPAVWHKKGAE